MWLARRPACTLALEILHRDIGLAVIRAVYIDTVQVEDSRRTQISSRLAATTVSGGASLPETRCHFRIKGFFSFLVEDSKSFRRDRESSFVRTASRTNNYRAGTKGRVKLGTFDRAAS